MSKNSSRHLKILGARMFVWTKFGAEVLQILGADVKKFSHRGALTPRIFAPAGLWWRAVDLYWLIIEISWKLLKNCSDPSETFKNPEFDKLLGAFAHPAFCTIPPSCGLIYDTVGVSYCASPATRWLVSVVNTAVKFYILLTAHHVKILGKWPTWCTNYLLCVYLYL